jgi:hypothetical protein
MDLFDHQWALRHFIVLLPINNMYVERNERWPVSSFKWFSCSEGHTPAACYTLANHQYGTITHTEVFALWLLQMCVKFAGTTY